MWNPSRREFLKSTVTTVCSAGLGALSSTELFGASRAWASAATAPTAAPLPIKKVLVFNLLPLEEELRMVIAIEEVWNKFLLRPLEMAKYIGEFQSPWIQAWFDVGNVMFYGYPQDWIRTLGKSIAKVHLKDFKRKENGYEWVNLGDGDGEWEAVREAFREIGYAGSAITELAAGDEAYLRDVSRRVERLMLGEG